MSSLTLRPSLAPEIDSHDHTSTLGDKLRRLRIALGASRHRGVALFACCLLLIAAAGHFSTTAHFRGQEDAGDILSRAANNILRSRSIFQETKPAEEEPSSPDADTDSRPDAVANNAAAGAEAVIGPTRPQETEQFASDEPACSHSLKDTRGLVCVDNAMWSRILEEDALAWGRINSSVRALPDDKGRPVRGRYDSPSVPYPESVGVGQHNAMRRDYLQAVWVPTLSCPEEARVGELGDGGKWVCGLGRVGVPSHNPPATDGCLIYSFGSNNLFGFEEAMLRRTPRDSACEIEVFDHTAQPTWTPPNSPRVRLHRLGIAAAGAAAEGPQLLSYAGLKERLGQSGRNVNVLKMDIEGAEFAVLPEIIRGGNPPQQLLLETHLPGAPDLGVRDADALLLALRKAGYVMTHTEVNYNGALNYNEYSFLHLASRTTTTNK